MAKNLTVVVAEDDPDTRTVIQHALSKAGYTVTMCNDGQAAWDELQAHKPDLAILDIMMPKLNGLTIEKAIRADDSLRDVPVVILSALICPQDDSNVFVIGDRRFMAKPFSVKELLLLVEEIIGLPMPD